MSNRQIYLADLYSVLMIVVKCSVSVECGSVCKDLVVEQFIRETWNFQERQYIMCSAIKLLKSDKISRYLVVFEKKTGVHRWDAFKAWKLFKITWIFLHV